MTINCRKCLLVVSQGQEAISCDECEGWTHRLCGTRVSKKKYEEADRTGSALAFTCSICKETPRESSGIDHSDGSFHGRVESLMTEIAGTVTFDVNLSAIDSEGTSNLSDILEEDIQERSVEDDSINYAVDEIPEDPGNTWTVLEKGSQKGKKRLVDSFGYFYVVKRENTKQTNWRCSARIKSRCPATVTQKGTKFTPSNKPHNHTANPGKLQASQVRIKIKEDATKELFKSAATIVEDAVTTLVPPDAPCGARENMNHLIRIANRARERNRPKDPQDLDFEISTTFIPVGFLKADLTNREQRHLILATDRQLLELSKSKQWYLDGTFKVVKRPFYQLLSVHSFVRSKQDVKMMPLIFVIMSSRTKCDYVKVFNKLLDLLPMTPSVESIVMDFEAATWGALKVVMPDVKLRGCLFHYTQAVWRRVQEIGLTVAYREKNSVFRFIRKLMALPFIPASEIRTTFEELTETVNLSSKLRKKNFQFSNYCQKLVASWTIPPHR